MNNIKVSTKSKAASSNVCLMVFIIDKLQDYWLIGNKFFVDNTFQFGAWQLKLNS